MLIGYARVSTAEQSLALQQDALASAGCGRVFTDEAIDTTTSDGKLSFHSFGALADFERDIIRERTRAGLAAARARGRMGGRPPALSPTQVEMARALLADPARPIPEVCAALRVSKATRYRYVPARTRGALA